MSIPTYTDPDDRKLPHALRRQPHRRRHLPPVEETNGAGDRRP